MTVPIVIRKGVEGLAIFAVVNLVLQVGLIAYVLGSDMLDQQKLSRIARILQGEPETPREQQPPSAPTKAALPQEDGTTTDALVSTEDREIARLEADRLKVELEQQLALVQSMMLKVSAEREAFRREQALAAQREQRQIEALEDKGFQKQVELFNALNPSVAVQHLLKIADPDEAARLIMALDTRKAKKIIEAAKTGPDAARMREILRRLGEPESILSAPSDTQDAAGGNQGG